MMKHIVIQLIAIIFVFLWTLSGIAQKIQKIDAGKGLKTEKPVLLKDIAREVEYIRLETNEKCLIGGAGHLIAADAENIIVADKAFYRFGRDGKFKNSISGRGKGPGEYVEIAGFEIDPATGTFFVFDRLGKVINFRLNGELIGDQRVSSALYVTLFGEDKVLNLYSSRFTMLSGGYRVVISDRKGNPVKKMLKIDQESLDNIQNLTVQNSRLSGYRDSITVWEGLCDTVYRISNDFNITPRFLLDLGKDRLPRVLPITPNSPDYRAEIYKYIMPVRYFDNGRNLFLESSDQGIPKLQICSKNDGVCTTLPVDSKIINDFDGGPDFWPLGITSVGKLYMLMDIVALKEYRTPNSENTLKYPERQKEIIRMLETRRIDDNPIIMIVTPKAE